MLDQTIGKRALPVIDMRDDAEIADFGEVCHLREAISRASHNCQHILSAQEIGAPQWPVQDAGYPARIEPAPMSTCMNFGFPDDRC